jgi:hypothetical protein
MSVMRGYREQSINLTSYIVRLDVFGQNIGSTQSGINASIAAAVAAGNNVSVIGNVIEIDPVVRTTYFIPDVILFGGKLLRDLGKDLYFTYKGELYLKARLVCLAEGLYTEGTTDISSPFYVNTFESYSQDQPNGEDVYVIRVT